MESKKIKKAQAFSTDILVVVVIVLFGAIFLVMNQINNAQDGSNLKEKYEKASLEAELVVNDLKEKEILKENNEIDVDKLLVLDEAGLREELGISSKFCIVFEKDGKLVKIDPNSNVFGVGSSDIVVNGEPCQ